MPSRGNPLFEGCSLAEHAADIQAARFIRQGYVEEEAVADPTVDEIAKHLKAGRDPIREMFGAEAAALWDEDD